jgi:putative membrane protein
MNKRLLITIAAITLSAAFSGCSSSNTDSSKFLSKALQDGLAEIHVCQLALQRTGSDDVRRFAERMIQDHTRTDQEITQLASRKGVQLPQDVSEKQKLTYDALSKLSGASLDKEFMDHNVSDHEGDVKDFQEQVEKGTDADVKAFASKTLQMLEMHLQMSKEVDGKVKS